MAQRNPFASPELGHFYGGAIPTPNDPRDWRFPRYKRMPAAMRTNNDLRQYQGQSLAMPIGNQLQVGSCTAWAWGYYLRGALSARWHVDNGTAPDLPDTLAPRFIYDMERSAEYLNTYPQDSGADMRSGGKVLLDYGVPPERDCPYTGKADNGNVDSELTPHMREAAAFYGVSGYYRLQGAGETLIDSIIQALAGRQPVVLAVLVPSSFEQTGSNGRVPAPVTSDQILGGHAICVFGNYIDASFAGGGALVFANSWGESWGDRGWGYLPFAYSTTQHRQYGPFLSEAWTAV